MGFESQKERVCKLADENREKIVSMAQYLFDNPEIALEEVKACAYITDFLRKEGFEVEEKFEGMETAFKAVKKNGDGPRIAFLAEYDALPGCGHACGHHMIASMSVGAALALAEVLDTYPGEIAIFGTPAEETGDGKVYLADRGVFKGYDVAMMLHPNARTTIYPKMIAIGGMDFNFTGKASHAGTYPYDGVNALDAVVLLYNNVNALRQQLKDGTRIHGIILEAGKAANVIPDKGVVRLEFRAKEQDYFEEVVQKVVNCAKAAALATGCELEYDWFEPVCKGLKSNRALEEVMEEFFPQFGVDDFILIDGGSSDIGNVSWEVPTIEPMLGVCEGEPGIHTADFRDATMLPYGLDRMIVGVKLLALTGLRILDNPKLLEKIREEM